jgi:hypothetical protein
MEVYVYTFEDRDGNEFGAWTTQDFAKAEAYAQEHKLRVIGNRLTFEDRDLMVDYTGADDEDTSEHGDDTRTERAERRATERPD